MMDDPRWREAFDIPLKQITIGTYKASGVNLHYMGHNEYIIPLNTMKQIMFKLEDIASMEQCYKPGNIFCRFVFRPTTAKLIATLIPEGSKFLFYSKNVDERTFLIQFPDDLDEVLKSTIKHLFSAVTPILEDHSIHSILDGSESDEPDEPDAMIDILSIEKANGYKHKGSPSEGVEFSPPDKKKPKKQVSGDKQTVPTRSLRSKNRVKYTERDTSDYYADENTIPEHLRNDRPDNIEGSVDNNGAGSSKKEAPIVIDRFSEYENSTVLANYRDIVIRMEDYKCLDYRELVNDVILDFYLKYIYHEMMTEEQRQSVHIYNTPFYSLYATSSNFSGWKDGENKDLSASSKRYDRVRNLPSNRDVNIFDKDFIVFPCNYREHWFLTIACYPKLNGAINANGELVEGDDARRDMKNPESGEPLKTACILVLDSVKSNAGRRTTAIQHIRRFLLSDYLEHYQADFPFEANKIFGNSPKCPQQSNATDCGLFVLEFVERFFITTPVTDFRLPLDLSTWFDPSIIVHKRERIGNIIRELMEVQQHSEVLLPPIVFRKEPKSKPDVQVVDECMDANGNENGNENNNQEEFNNNNDFNFADNNKLEQTAVVPMDTDPYDILMDPLGDVHMDDLQEKVDNSSVKHVLKVVDLSNALEKVHEKLADKTAPESSPELFTSSPFFDENSNSNEPHDQAEACPTKSPSKPNDVNTREKNAPKDESIDEAVIDLDSN